MKGTDISLAFRQAGEGQPLILLHGNGEDGGYFQRQMEPFSRHFRVIALDTRGHGASPRGEGEFSLARFAGDLRRFMDGQSIDKAHILGFSDGGNVALLFALEHPERVSSLILNGANLSPAGLKASVRLTAAAGYWLTSLLSRFDKGQLRQKELFGLMVSEPRISPAALSAVTAPALIIAGKNDMIKDSHTRLIAASIKNSRLRIIEGDHFIAARQSERFNAEALDFLLGASGQKTSQMLEG